jgi:hypothetical protein
LAKSKSDKKESDALTVSFKRKIPGQKEIVYIIKNFLDEAGFEPGCLTFFGIFRVLGCCCMAITPIIFINPTLIIE